MLGWCYGTIIICGVYILIVFLLNDLNKKLDTIYDPLHKISILTNLTCLGQML